MGLANKAIDSPGSESIHPVLIGQAKNAKIKP